MTRFIVIGLLIIILRLAVKNFSGQLKAAVFGAPDSGPPKPAQVAAETLVQCSACGTYVASPRAIKEGRVVFCSEECRQGKG